MRSRHANLLPNRHRVLYYRRCIFLFLIISLKLCQILLSLIEVNREICKLYVLVVTVKKILPCVLVDVRSTTLRMREHTLTNTRGDRQSAKR